MRVGGADLGHDHLLALVVRPGHEVVLPLPAHLERGGAEEAGEHRAARPCGAGGGLEECVLVDWRAHGESEYRRSVGSKPAGPGAAGEEAPGLAILPSGGRPAVHPLHGVRRL